MNFGMWGNALPVAADVSNQQLHTHQLPQKSGSSAEGQGRVHSDTDDEIGRSCTDTLSNSYLAAALARKAELQNQLATLERARLRYQEERMIYPDNQAQNPRNFSPNLERLALLQSHQNGRFFNVGNSVLIERASLQQSVLNKGQQSSQFHHRDSSSANKYDGMSQTNEERTGRFQKMPSDINSQSPGNIIAPCVARGMPIDHNYKTAFFIISNETKHGDELSCSYSACRNSGIKFRYCAHCKLPVSKMMFHKNHSHYEHDPQEKQSHDNKKCPVAAAASKRQTSQLSQLNTSYATVSEESGDSMCTSQSTVMTDVHHDDSSLLRRKRRHFFVSSGSKQKRPKFSVKRDHTNSTKKSSDKSSVETKGSTKKDPKEIGSDDMKMKSRRDQWFLLFDERPLNADKKAVEEWMCRVLTTSDEIWSMTRVYHFKMTAQT